MFSFRESTWNRKTQRHECCGSKHSYHYSSCPNRVKIPGRASDHDFMQVQAHKEQGMTSREVAATLNMPLEQVNDLWII